MVNRFIFFVLSFRAISRIVRLKDFFNREAKLVPRHFSSLSGPQDKSYVEAHVYKTGAERKRRRKRRKEREDEAHSRYAILHRYIHTHKILRKKCTHLWNRSDDISRTVCYFADLAIQITLYVIYKNNARAIFANWKKKMYDDVKRYNIKGNRMPSLRPAMYCSSERQAASYTWIPRQTVASLSFSILRLSRFALLIRQLCLSLARYSRRFATCAVRSIIRHLKFLSCNYTWINEWLEFKLFAHKKFYFNFFLINFITMY